MPSDSVRAAIDEAVTAIAPTARAVSESIHRTPEVSFEEHHAAAVLVAWLQQEGFAVEEGIAGLPTAFRASLGSGSPRIAYLLEYDALPRLGHACGHNLIAAGGVLAASALARVQPSLRTGTVVVIGTPGEEGKGGKIIELGRGVFDDVDVALMFHPADRTLPWRSALACLHYQVTYRGRAAHAAKNPQDGLNALAAMIQFFVGLDGLRQHIDPRARIHGVITNGGAAANVVPDLTEATLYVRHPTAEGARLLVDRVRNCVLGAAMATGTAAEFDEAGPMYAERRNNLTLAARIGEYLAAIGLDVQTPREDDPAGSSDIGNVSERLPCVHPYVQIAPTGTPGHSDAMRVAAATEPAQQAMISAARALALAGADLLEDPGFLAAVRAEFAGSS